MASAPGPMYFKVSKPGLYQSRVCSVTEVDVVVDRLFSAIAFVVAVGDRKRWVKALVVALA